MKADFRLFFLLFMASVRSWKPGPTLVPGVFPLCLQRKTNNLFESIPYQMKICVKLENPKCTFFVRPQCTEMLLFITNIIY